ncbi:MAG: PEGA domain-containing protein [Polyangiaceae bacterium]
MLAALRLPLRLRYALVACLRGAVLAAPVLPIVLCSRSAAGQDKQDKKELSKARAQFQRAIELEQAGNYTAALEQFRDVGQVRMTAQVRFHIATCEERLGRLVTALGGYQLAFADADSVGEDFKSEVDSAVTRLQASIPKLVIQRGTGAEAAEIQLDGVALGASSVGVAVPLDPGPHAVTAKAPGFLSFNQTVSIAENEEKKVEIVLAPEPSEASVAVGRPGEKPSTTLVPYVIGGVGVASLIGSGVLFALRQSTLSDLEKKCGPDRNQCPNSAAGEVSNLGLYNVTAQIALGVGVVGVGTAVTMLVLQRKHAPPPTTLGTTFVPSAPNSALGMSWVHRF